MEKLKGQGPSCGLKKGFSIMWKDRTFKVTTWNFLNLNFDLSQILHCYNWIKMRFGNDFSNLVIFKFFINIS